jgi:hypothetical protein
MGFMIGVVVGFVLGYGAHDPLIRAAVSPRWPIYVTGYPLSRRARARRCRDMNDRNGAIDTDAEQMSVSAFRALMALCAPAVMA